MSTPEQFEELPQMRTIKEASNRLGISVSTVWKLVRANKLTTYTVGGLGVTRLREDELTALLQPK